jgi:hypothetical protein
MTHQPKGSMCMSCRHAFDDCSHLPFSTMPAISKSKGRIIVRCTEFEHARSIGDHDGRHHRVTAVLASS